MVKRMLPQFEKVSLGTLLTLILHTSAAIWYASNLTTRIDGIEKIINGNRPINERMATIEEGIEYLKKSQERVENRLDTIMGKHNASF